MLGARGLGAVAGSVALLLRSRHAVRLFVLSFAGMIGNTIYGRLIAPTPMSEIAGPAALWFMLAVVVVAVFPLLHSAAMARRGVLR